MSYHDVSNHHTAHYVSSRQVNVTSCHVSSNHSMSFYLTSLHDVMTCHVIASRDFSFPWFPKLPFTRCLLLASRVKLVTATLLVTRTLTKDWVGMPHTCPHTVGSHCSHIFTHALFRTTFMAAAPRCSLSHNRLVCHAAWLCSSALLRFLASPSATPRDTKLFRGTFSWQSLCASACSQEKHHTLSADGGGWWAKTMTTKEVRCLVKMCVVLRA